MALSMQRRKQGSQAFNLEIQEERLRAELRGQTEESAPSALLALHDRFGNQRVAGALDLGSLMPDGLTVGESPLSGHVGFVHDQLSLALAGLETGLFSGDVSNAAVMDAMSYAGAPGYEGDYASGTAFAADAAMRREEALDYDPNAPAVQNLHARGGTPLPGVVAARMGSAFGHDFGHVRIHADAQAQAASDALNARAFAIGSHIWFGRGAWNPGSAEGDRVLAHELTHVVQSDEGRLPAPSGEGLDVSSPTDTAEREAYGNEHAILAKLGGPSTDGGAGIDAAPEALTAQVAVEAGADSAGVGAAPEAAVDEGEATDLAANQESGVSRDRKKFGALGVPEVKDIVGTPVAGPKPGAKDGDDMPSVAGVPNASELASVAQGAVNSAIKGALGPSSPVTMDVVDLSGQRSGPLLAGGINMGGVNAKIDVDKDGGVSGSASVSGQDGPLKGAGNVAFGPNGVTGSGSLSVTDAKTGSNANLQLGPDGANLAAQVNGPDGKPIASGSVQLGPDGKPVVQGQVGDGKDVKLGPDGKPVDAKEQLGPDGKPLAPGLALGPDGKPTGAAGSGAGGAGAAAGGGAGGSGGPGGGGGGGSGGGAGADLSLGGGGGAALLAAGKEPRALGSLSLVPFDLAKEAAAKLQKSTGRTPEQHQQAISEHVERIRRQVDDLREGLRRYSAEKSAAIDAEVTASRAALAGDITGAQGRIAGAYSAAKGALGTAATEALTGVTTAGTTAKGTLATSLPTQLTRLATMITTARTRVTALGPVWKGKFKTALDDGSKEFQTLANTCATELETQRTTIVGSWPDTGDALVRAENEARRKAGEKGVTDAVADFRAGAPIKAAAARAQLPQYDGQIDAALASVGTALDGYLTSGTTQLNTAKTQADARVDSQTVEATTAITGAKTSAEAALDQGSAAAQAELVAAQTRNDQDLVRTGDSAKASITSTDTTVRERYADWFQNVLVGLPKDQATTYDSVKEFLDGRERELPTFHAGVMTELDTACEAARQTVIDATTNARTAVGTLTESSIRSAQTQARAQADGIKATGARFGVSITSTGSAVDQAFTQHITPMQALIDTRVTATTTSFQTALDGAKTTLTARANAYAAELRQRIAAMPRTLAPMVNAAARGVYDNLRGRAQKVYSACAGMGTDENGVYNALRGLTAIQGQALETVVWGRLFRGNTLRGTIDDDMNDDEKKIAYAYLSGNTALGARLELDSTMHWYGDDEAQIEKILRELSPEDREAMKAQPEWQAVHDRLKDNLGGTDLNVTEALLVGNAARADAYRLKDSIDEARRSSDPDALHKALEGVDPAQLAAVQQEFHNIQNGVKPDATNVAPIDPATAARELGDYVVADVAGVDANGHPTTLSITGANKDLARSLAMEGRDSVTAAVSRFEVERTRDGGPQMENMEKALMAPADLQARLHDPDPTVRAAAQADQDRREAQVRAGYQAAYGGPEGRTMDAAINGMNTGSDERSSTSRRVMQNMLSDGTNTPRVAADMIFLGADGAGTDEKQIKRALTGLRPDEVQALASTYATEHGNGDPTALYQALGVNRRGPDGNPIPGQNYSGFGSELSGDDRREVEELLLGDPKYMTLQQQMGLANVQRDWATGSEQGFMASLGGAGDEAADLERNFGALTNLQGRMRPDGTFANAEDAKEFERLCGDVGVNATEYRASIDRTANYITTGVAIVGAIVVTAATFGSGAPAGAAMIMAAAGTAASGAISMGVNYGMKGGRYGWEQAVTDAGMTAVQTATAGLGAYANAAKIGQGALGVVGGQMAVGAGTGFVNGAATTALTDGTWDRGIMSGLGQVGIGGAKQAGMEAASAGISGGVEESAIGQRMQAAGVFQSSLLKGTSNALGSVGSTSVGLTVDAARGKFKGESWDVAQAIGTEAGKSFVMGAGGGAAGTALKGRLGSAPPAGPGAPGPGGNDNGGPPGGGTAGHDPHNNTPPPHGGGAPTGDSSAPAPVQHVATPDAAATQTQQADTGTAGPTPAHGHGQVDPATGRPPAGTSTDASTQQTKAGNNEGDATIIKNNGENTVVTRDRVVTANDQGVHTVDADGTQTLIDPKGNRTVVDSSGTQRTITPDGDLVIRAPGGEAMVVTPDGQRIPLDHNGKPVTPDVDTKTAADPGTAGKATPAPAPNDIPAPGPKRIDYSDGAAVDAEILRRIDTGENHRLLEAAMRPNDAVERGKVLKIMDDYAAIMNKPPHTLSPDEAATALLASKHLGDPTLDAAAGASKIKDEASLTPPPVTPDGKPATDLNPAKTTDTAVVPGAPKLVGPEAGQAVTTPKQGDTPLIGLKGDFYDPKATGEQLRTQLTEEGVPRQQKLSEAERAEETRFADWAQKNVGAASDGAKKLAEAIGTPDQPIFEVDAMKRLLPEYGPGSKPASPEEKAYRLEMNHALHPTAVAVARLGFQERLDVLALLPDGHPSKQVFVTSGGCAAGKGDLTGIVKDAMGDRAKFGAVWDAAGEGDAGENSWVLRAATERGIKVVFGYAEADPTTRFQSVLERAEGSGRVVDVMTFINSYSDGAAAFKTFMDSPEYKAAVAAGNAEAFGIAPGEFNRASLTDKSQKAYPDVKPLNEPGAAFGAQHVGDPPNKQQALEASLRILEDHVRTQRAAGKNPDAVARGALENAIKFLDGQPPEVRVAVLESYARIFGGAPK